MEAKFLASAFSFLSIFLAIYAQSLVANSDDSTEFEFETAIYYGDSNVNLGEPFSITCIIPISDPIHWIKDGEPITRHNLRHGRDEHSYMLAESAIEGEKHKIEAHITVRHALKVHEGKYQCNNLHSSYHMLHVRAPKQDTNLPPLLITADDNDLSTQSVYETIHDLTPSSGDDIFTRVWESGPIPPDGVMPAQTQPTTFATQHQHRQHQQYHHHHNQQKQQQQQQQQELSKLHKQQHKLIYINATNFDGNPRSSSASGSNENLDLINLEYIPPTTRHNDLTTVSWKPVPGNAIGSDMHPKSRPQYPPPPDFPPPRTTMLAIRTTALPPVPMYTPQQEPIDHRHHQYHVTNTAITTATGSGYEEQQSRFPLKTLQKTYYNSNNNQQQTTLNTMTTFVTPTSYNPHLQQYNPVMQTHHPQQQHHHISTASTFAAMPTIVGTSIAHPKVIVPKKKDPDFLVPNYDNVEHQLKVFEIRNPLVLSCNITQEGQYDLTWEKNGTEVSKVKELEGRYRIIAPERKFIIDRTDIHDDGLYSCVANNQKRDINVIARVVVRVPSNTGVVEGEKLSIVCTVVGTDPQLSWTIGNLTINTSTGRYILKAENQVENAILSVENVSLDDRGEFKCIGRNAANEYVGYAEASDASFVRVKGKLAALWPFLGICAEVLILCTIILIYEKRRNKSELEESDTDPQEQKKKRRNYE